MQRQSPLLGQRSHLLSPLICWCSGHLGDQNCQLEERSRLPQTHARKNTVYVLHQEARGPNHLQCQFSQRTSSFGRDVCHSTWHPPPLPALRANINSSLFSVNLNLWCISELFAERFERGLARGPHTALCHEQLVFLTCPTLTSSGEIASFSLGKKRPSPHSARKRCWRRCPHFPNGGLDSCRVRILGGRNQE